MATRQRFVAGRTVCLANRPERFAAPSHPVAH
jgi:hypothetical protein